MQQLISSRTQLDRLAEVLGEQVAGSSPEERAARAELASDALQLLQDAEAAVESGETDAAVALVNAIDRLAVQLRDRVLDEVVASSPVPDQWPM